MLHRSTPPGAPPRPRARRALVSLCGLLLAAVLVLQASPASAGRTWCKLDPVVKIDGKVADIYLSSDPALHDAATGPAEIVVALPRGSTGVLLAVDRGFGRHGYVVRFVADETLERGGGGARVRVQAYVPSSDGSLPLRVDFVPRSSDLAAAGAQGRVNTWVALETQ